MPQLNKSIERVGIILHLFSESKPIWGVTEISKKLNVSIVTTNNFIRSLEKIGFLESVENSRKYKLGKRILGIGSIVASNLELNQMGGELATALSSRIGLPCRLGIWDKDAALTTFRATTDIGVSSGYQFGPRILAYCSAMGRALLAYFEKNELDSYFKGVELRPITPKTKTDIKEIMEELEQTKIRGFSISDEEISLGKKNLGAPILNNKTKVVGAITILGGSEILIGREMETVVNELKDTASQISQKMGYHPEVA